MDQEEYLRRAKLAHGDAYEYAETIYAGERSRVKIGCKIHGVFEKRASYHISPSAPQGCPKCQKITSGLKATKTTEYFIQKAKEVHGDLYDYSKSVYTKKDNYLIITCKIHGDFNQTPNKHHSGRGCQKCGEEKAKQQSIKSLLSIEDIENRINKIYHGSIKVLESSNSGACSPQRYSCDQHGEFTGYFHNLMKGRGCPYCQTATKSKAEKLIVDWLKNDLGITNVQRSNRQLIKPLEIDIYLPEYKIGIEYCGLYWHSEDRKGRNYHVNKMEKAKAAGIQIMHIFADEFMNENKRAILFSALKHKLAKGIGTTTIHGRKCKLVELETKKYCDFVNENHLQGADNPPIRLGLEHESKLIAVMSFIKPPISGGNNSVDFLISRFCIAKNYKINGAFSKLMKEFISKWNPKSIGTYADLRYSEGKVYSSNGFKMEYDTKPNYWYFKGDEKRYHRFGFRKSLLPKKLVNFNPNLTEYENMKKAGWNRIWDCGNRFFSKIIV